MRSPVLVLTCNRIDHFRALVESLARCFGADDTELYIAVDGPFNTSVKAANDAIIRYSESLTGFANVHLFKRGDNVGPSANLGLAVDDVFKVHDTLILLEDDNVVAMNFLSYMNAALSRFRHDPKCFAVCGYNLPVAKAAPCATDIYSSPLVNAWGVGFFRERYIRPDLEAKKKLDCFFLNPLNVLKAHLLSPPLFSLLVHMHMSHQDFADVFFAQHALRNKMVSIYPVDTKVMNMGFDGSGVHCGRSDTFIHSGFVNAERNDLVLDLDDAVDKHYRRVSAHYFKVAFGHYWGRTFYSYLLYLLCLLVGPDQTAALRDFTKTQLRKLTRRRP